MNRFALTIAALVVAVAPYAVQAQQQQQVQPQQQQVQPQQQQVQQQQAQPQQQQQMQQVQVLQGEQIDQAFAEVAAQAGMAEVQLSELATQQSQSEEVTNFAQRMIQDHQQANQELMQIAQQLGVQPPQQLDTEHQLTATALSTKQGAEFDEAYMRDQIRAHEEAISLYEFASQNAQDEQLRTFAQNTLPILQEHLQLAQQTAKQLGIDA